MLAAASPDMLGYKLFDKFSTLQTSKTCMWTPLVWLRFSIVTFAVKIESVWCTTSLWESDCVHVKSSVTKVITSRARTVRMKWSASTFLTTPAPVWPLSSTSSTMGKHGSSLHIKRTRSPPSTAFFSTLESSWRLSGRVREYSSGKSWFLPLGLVSGMLKFKFNDDSFCVHV